MDFGRSCVGFIDIEYDHLDEYKDIPAMYDEYIKKKPNEVRLLASATDFDDIKEIYNRHSDVIRGFGELKLYDSFKGKEVNFKRLSFARRVCEFSRTVGNLPVYIHYELTKDIEVQRFDKLLADFPEVPIVLCHCGMNECNQEYAWAAAKKLAHEHGNCWLDLSWDAAKWLSSNPMLITQLPTDRCIWGADTSPRLKAHEFKSATLDDIYTWRNAIQPYFNSDNNIKRLFNENS